MITGVREFTLTLDDQDAVKLEEGAPPGGVPSDDQPTTRRSQQAAEEELADIPQEDRNILSEAELAAPVRELKENLARANAEDATPSPVRRGFVLHNGTHCPLKVVATHQTGAVTIHKFTDRPGENSFPIEHDQADPITKIAVTGALSGDHLEAVQLDLSGIEEHDYTVQTDMSVCQGKFLKLVRQDPAEERVRRGAEDLSSDLDKVLSKKLEVLSPAEETAASGSVGASTHKDQDAPPPGAGHEGPPVAQLQKSGMKKSPSAESNASGKSSGSNSSGPLAALSNVRFHNCFPTPMVFEVVHESGETKKVSLSPNEKASIRGIVKQSMSASDASAGSSSEVDPVEKMFVLFPNGGKEEFDIKGELRKLAERGETEGLEIIHNRGEERKEIGAGTM